MNATTTLHDSGQGVRFSRRLGEQVPDVHYACAIEGPRVSRRTIMRVWVGVIVLLAVALAVAKVAA
jgi:hypothetical protein